MLGLLTSQKRCRGNALKTPSLSQLSGARRSQQKTLQSSPNECHTPAPRMLSEQELKSALCNLPGWSRQGNKLQRQYHFSSFEKALGFLSGLALVAQAMEHNLESEEIYDRVIVELTTPEIEGIADVDVELAHQADALAVSLKLPQHDR